MPDVRFSELCGFTPRQWQATDAADAHRYTLFGGSRGPGKSYWLRWYLVRFLILAAGEHGLRRVRVMLACEDYPSLRERQISKIETEFPPALGKYYPSVNEFELLPKFGSGVIALRNLDKPEKYQSAEYACIAVDEITKNPEKVFHILRGSMRWPGYENTRLIAASNPAANFVRDWWISKQLPEELQPEAAQFAFVPALPTDNPHLAPSYWQMLETLPGALRAAWLHGDWFAATEGLVYETFTADNLTDDEPDPERPIELAIDDGYIDPRATLFIQRQPGGDVLVFAELYQTKTLEERTVEDIIALCERNGWPRPELAAVSHEAPALRERLRRADIPARNWLAAKNLVSGERSKRVAAIKRTRGLICDGQGHRAIKVNRRCKSLIDEIMAGYKYPEGKKSTVDDLPEDGTDHAVNALESWVFLRMGRG
jgi:hypothetical protein